MADIMTENISTDTINKKVSVKCFTLIGYGLGGGGFSGHEIRPLAMLTAGTS